MLNTYRVSFIGHREVENPMEVERRLMGMISNIIRTHEFVDFYVGRNGEFDIMVASCIKRLQATHGKERCAMTLVLPYLVADLEYYAGYYDSIIIPEEAQAAHFKTAITKRNAWFVENSDLLVAYVIRDKGGAAACLKMAKNSGLLCSLVCGA